MQKDSITYPAVGDLQGQEASQQLHRKSSTAFSSLPLLITDPLSVIKICSRLSRVLQDAVLCALWIWLQLFCVFFLGKHNVRKKRPQSLSPPKKI